MKRKKAVHVAGYQVKLLDGQCDGIPVTNRVVRGNKMSDGSVYWKFSSQYPDRKIVRRVRLSRDAIMAMFSIMAKFEGDRKQ